jgi:hypothetical protein
MTTKDVQHFDPELDAFIQRLLRRSAEIRLPELFREKPGDALYYVAGRSGISVVALNTSALTAEQLVKVLTYRLAQYVTVSFVDPKALYEARMEHEPLSSTSPNDVHVIVGLEETGELLCYVALKSAVDAPLHVSMRTQERSLLHAEHLFGRGIFNRLRVLPDLPVAKIRELGRFVKNQQRFKSDELSARAAIEAPLAMIKLMMGPLRQQVDACIGDFEEEVAKRNMDFFHLPLVFLPGVVPYLTEGDYLSTRYRDSALVPFALLTSDLSMAIDRLSTIEHALSTPGIEGLKALAKLKKDGTRSPRSSLEPLEGIAPLSQVVMPQKGVEMEVRRNWLDAGEELRKCDLFKSLSDAEAVVLARFMEHADLKPGEVIVHQGNSCDALYMIEMGEAEIQVQKADGTRMTVGKCGPGDLFGEIALVTGGERTADVVAKTSMRLMKLSKDAYARFITHMPEVEAKLHRVALQKAQEQLRTLKS